MRKAVKSVSPCSKSAKYAMIALLIVAALFGFAVFFMPQVRAVRERFIGRLGGIENFNDGKKGDTVQLVHAQWCGHCVSLLSDGGDWDQLKAELPGVKFAELDESSAEGRAAIAEGNITGFPDIRITQSTNAGPVTVEKYSGARTADAMKDWILQHIDTV